MRLTPSTEPLSVLESIELPKAVSKDAKAKPKSSKLSKAANTGSKSLKPVQVSLGSRAPAPVEAAPAPKEGGGTYPGPFWNKRGNVLLRRGVQ